MPWIFDTNSYFVDPSAADDTGDGRTEANARKTIAGIIALSPPAGSTIFLAGGTHTVAAGTDITVPTKVKWIGSGRKSTFIEGDTEDTTGLFYFNAVISSFENISIDTSGSSDGSYPIEFGTTVSKVEIKNCTLKGDDTAINIATPASSRSKLSIDDCYFDIDDNNAISISGDVDLVVHNSLFVGDTRSLIATVSTQKQTIDWKNNLCQAAHRISTAMPTIDLASTGTGSIEMSVEDSTFFNGASAAIETNESSTGIVTVYDGGNNINFSDIDLSSGGVIKTTSTVKNIDWYVAAYGNGGLDTNDGTKESPFITIGKALTMISDGDTIHIGAGTWTETLDLTSTKDITICGLGVTSAIQSVVAVQSDGVVNCGDNTVIKNVYIYAQAGGNGCPISFINKRKLTVQNCTLIGQDDGIYADHVGVLTPVLIKDCLITSVYDTIRIKGICGVVIENCDLQLDATATTLTSVIAASPTNGAPIVVTVRNCQLTATRGGDYAGLTHDMACVSLTGVGNGHITIENCNMNIEATDGTDNGDIYGVYCSRSNAVDTNNVSVIDSSFTSRHDGTGDAYDAGTDASSTIRIANSIVDAAKMVGNVTELPSVAQISSNLIAGQIGTDTATTEAAVTTTGVELKATQTAAWAANLVRSAGIMQAGTATGGTQTTLIDTGLAEGINDTYNDRIVMFLTGTLKGQVASISDYVASTDTFTISQVTTAPTNENYIII